MAGTGALDEEDEIQILNKLRDARYRRVYKLVKANELGRAFNVLQSTTTLATPGKATLEFFSSLSPPAAYDEAQN